LVKKKKKNNLMQQNRGIRGGSVRSKITAPGRPKIERKRTRKRRRFRVVRKKEKRKGSCVCEGPLDKKGNERAFDNM